MKRFPIFGFLLLIPAVALLWATGCKEHKTESAASATPSPTGPAPAKVALKGPQDAVLTGTVKISGARPEIEEEGAIQKYADKEKCLKGAGIHTKKQTWIIEEKDKGDGVANVVVWLEPGPGKKYADVESKTKDMFKDPRVIDQPYCQYIPHVVGVYAGVQKLEIKSSPNLGHNVKFSSKAEDIPQMDLGIGAPPKIISVKAERTPITVVCTVHSWMGAYVWAFDHPYFAVTDGQGKFEIKNIPSGEDLVLYVWHESMAAKTEADKARKLTTGANTYNTGITAKGELVK
jgi:hypothetical protein